MSSVLILWSGWLAAIFFFCCWAFEYMRRLDLGAAYRELAEKIERALADDEQRDRFDGEGS